MKRGAEEMSGVAAPRCLIRMPAVCERVGLKRSAIYRLIAAGKFPQPVRLLTGRRGSRWDSEAVDQWISVQIGLSHMRGGGR